jgi:hypothetical protein
VIEESAYGMKDRFTRAELVEECPAVFKRVTHKNHMKRQVAFRDSREKVPSIEAVDSPREVHCMIHKCREFIVV